MESISHRPLASRHLWKLKPTKLASNRPYGSEKDPLVRLLNLAQYCCPSIRRMNWTHDRHHSTACASNQWPKCVDTEFAIDDKLSLSGSGMRGIKDAFTGFAPCMGTPI